MDATERCPHCGGLKPAAANQAGQAEPCVHCGYPNATVQLQDGPPLLDATKDFHEVPETLTQSSGPAPTASFPETMGRYHVRDLIGRGGFGAVYRAYDPVLDREVALKVQYHGDDQPALQERFLREAKTAARLQHPGIVQVYDCGSAGEYFFIAAELVDGLALATKLKTERPTYRQAAQWVRDLALALHYAHVQGVVHRDVKPANILIHQNRARLTDFGLAKHVADPAQIGPANAAHDPALTLDGTVMGTIGYMAPEQARGATASIGPLSDVYSLGVVLFELLTGRRPYLGSSAEVLALTANNDVAVPRLVNLDSHVPRPLETITLKSLEKSPERRYASAADLAVDLQHWLNDEPIQATYRWHQRESTIDDGGGLVRRCPKCERETANKTKCLYCGEDLKDVKPVFSETALLPKKAKEKLRVRLCPNCTRHNAANLPSCRYCRANLTAVEPTEVTGVPLMERLRYTDRGRWRGLFIGPLVGVILGTIVYLVPKMIISSNSPHWGYDILGWSMLTGALVGGLVGLVRVLRGREPQMLVVLPEDDE